MDQSGGDSLEQRSVSIAYVLPALAALGLLCAGAAAAADQPMAPCDLPGVAGPVRCGVLDVLEDPDQASGRRMPIHMAVIPATSGKPLPDPIVVLMGGPGEDAISAAAIY